MVIALADAAEENQAKMFQAFAKLKSATHLVIMLISLWQKLSTDQTAILEATLLPLAEDTQELGWEETVDAAVSYLLRTCLSKSSKEQALTLSSQLSMPKDTSRLKKNITLFCDRLAKGGRLSLSTDSATQQAAVMPGGCATIPESDLEERTVIPGSTVMFASHGQTTKKKSKPDMESVCVALGGIRILQHPESDLSSMMTRSLATAVIAGEKDEKGASLIFISRFASTLGDLISPGFEFVLIVHRNAYVYGNFGKYLNAKKIDNQF
ncbi:hypothetical protein DUI87_18537 [Hirundo rustica rustica]|uniref:Uncharacterized protein n=1 Tax=Hirundo rustica rustica TaxID=333673 RepID=A0A3M0JX56_HIRRU|nr:hypothetical protein DUI87_18537 [Hirundo rustica rustica]